MSTYCRVLGLLILLSGCQYSATQLNLESLLDLIVNPTTKEPEKVTASPNAQCEAFCSTAVSPALSLVAIAEQISSSCSLASLVDSQVRVKELENLLKKNQRPQMEKSMAHVGKINKKCSTKRRPIPAKFEKLGSKFYYIEKAHNVNWFGALHTCRQMGAHLASPQNLEEFEYLRETAYTNAFYWLDINDLSNEGEYMSETTGKRAPFLLWAPDEPSNSNDIEHCIEMFNLTMNDANCYRMEYFICEAYSN